MEELQDAPYDFEIERVVKEVIEGGHHRVILQVPDGLKVWGVRLARVIESQSGAEVYLYGDKCFGACDLGVEHARRIGATLLVHYGHTEYSLCEHIYSTSDIRVIYIPARSRIKLEDNVVEELARFLADRGLQRPVLAAVVQHVDLLRELKAKLESKGLKPMIGSAPGLVEGQLLGCDYRVLTSVESLVDSAVVVCGGKFHALGASLAFDKPVVQVDPYTQRVTSMEDMRRRVLAVRYARMNEAMDARTWGVWIGVSTGQYRPSIVRLITKAIEKKGLRYVRFCSKYLSEEELGNLDSDEINVHVVTSCPRLPIDDLAGYRKPILTPGEALMVLEGSLERYRFPW